jgi:2-haloacid dehalogenase
MLLTDFEALTFDCYGTLIDWESGMVEALKGLTDRVQRPLTRDQILGAHARHESSQQHYTPATPATTCGPKIKRADLIFLVEL